MKKLTHDEAREILLKGGKVDAYFDEDNKSGAGPFSFCRETLRFVGNEGIGARFDYYDYFTEYKEPVTFDFWLNIYPNGELIEHFSKEDADTMTSSDRIACIHVKGKEGDGL